MNISEINIFGGTSSEEDPQVNSNESPDAQDDLDCPVLGLMENMYFEPRPYGTVLSVENTMKVLEEIGYQILARSEEKKLEQTIYGVYRRVSEELAIAKFVKDWKDVHGTDGDSGKA